jgi:hypothetical protein
VNLVSLLSAMVGSVLVVQRVWRMAIAAPIMNHSAMLVFVMRRGAEGITTNIKIVNVMNAAYTDGGLLRELCQCLFASELKLL